MKIIAKHSSGRILKGDAFQISNEAKQAKRLDPTVIDCTLGTFYHEDHSFQAFKTIEMILKNLPDDSFYDYSPTDGGHDFHEAVLNWVFEDTKAELSSKLHMKVLPTPGGTGALSCAIYNSLDHNEILLFPNLSWGPYAGIAANYGLNVSRFFLFDGEHFNMKGFIEKAEEIIEKQQKLVVIINDPCNNPTGYSLSDNELRQIIEFLNSKTKIPCVLIYDTAYLDFSYLGRDKTREKFLNFKNINENVMVLIAFSASKSFSVYGQRLGALIMMGKDLENITDFYNASNYTARNSWSNCNKGVINMMITLDKNRSLKAQFLKELDDCVQIIRMRSELFLKEANEVNLECYPYHSGFFVTMPTKNKEKALQLLKEKAKLYLLPFDNSVRIALCSIPLADVKGLAAKIKSVLDQVD